LKYDLNSNPLVTGRKKLEHCSHSFCPIVFEQIKSSNLSGESVK
jgi:hypothetical protein